MMATGKQGALFKKASRFRGLWRARYAVFEGGTLSVYGSARARAAGARPISSDIVVSVMDVPDGRAGRKRAFRFDVLVERGGERGGGGGAGGGGMGGSMARRPPPPPPLCFSAPSAGEKSAWLAALIRGSPRVREAAEAHYRRAEAAMRTQNYDAAEVALRAAIALDPAHAPAHFQLGCLLHQVRGDLTGAAAEYAAADTGVAYFNLGRLLEDRGGGGGGGGGGGRGGDSGGGDNMAAAREMYRTAIRAAAGDVEVAPDAMCNLGTLLVDLAAQQQQQQQQQQGQQGHGGAEGARKAEEQREAALREAESLFRQALATRPSCAMAAHNLGKLLADVRGDTAGAAKAFSQATRADPALVDAWLDHGAMLHERPETAAAAGRVYRAGIAACPGRAAPLHFNLAILLKNELDDMDGAIGSYEAAVAEAADPKAMRNLAALLRDVRGDLAGAERLYCLALTAEPGNEHGLQGLYKTLERAADGHGGHGGHGHGAGGAGAAGAATAAGGGGGIGGRHHDPIGAWVDQQEQGGEWPGVAVMLFEWAMKQSIEARV
jgi:tetratricopeptide (TPR) repeat protein